MGALTIFLVVMLLPVLLTQYSFANNATRGSFQQGYNQGIHDWNMFGQDKPSFYLSI